MPPRDPEAPPRLRLLPLLVGIATLAFVAHAATLAQAVGAVAQEVQSTEQNEEPEVLRLRPKSEEEVAHEAAEDRATAAGAAIPEGAELRPAPPGGWRDATDADIGGAQTQAAVRGELSARAAKLTEREKALAMREALLTATEKALAAKMAELEALRAEVAVDVGVRSEAHDAQINKLVKIYEGMKPKDAARMFDTQDMEILVAVAGKMSERKLAPILASMNPERARTLTARLAEATP